ncbi:MAG: hypothetical protein R3232_12110 [Clostridia bacterium]|nr:hypothetical protein [Clostridia bacterium]
MTKNTQYTENTSGKGKYAEVPNEIAGWNWGGFFLTWIWGLGNSTLIALLALVPILNLGVAIYLGAYGNELAWKNQYWHDVNDFKKTQRKWAIAGLAVTLVLVSLMALNIGLKISEKKQSNIMAKQVMEMVMQDTEARAIVGDDATIAANHGHRTVSVGNDIQKETHTIAIKSEKGMFTARANFRNHELEYIELITWGTGSDDQEKYTFKP